MIITGHRSNPFDLEGSFTIQFDSDDFATSAPLRAASARGFQLFISALSSPKPALHFLLQREEDGVQIDEQVVCPKRSRSFHSATIPFKSITQSATIGRFTFSLFWDGNKGLVNATWIVPRVATPPTVESSVPAGLEMGMLS